jgi:uncharacterized protein (TIGR02145 family)
MKNLLLLLLVSISPIILYSQNLDVEGQAKISVMNSDPTAQYVVVRQPNGILAVRDVSTLMDADSDSANEIQDLSLSGNILTITNNGTATAIDLSAYLDDTDTQLTESQVDAFVGNNGYLTTEIDGSITNEIQDLSLSGNILTITNNGTATAIDLSAYLDDTDTQLTESQVDAFVGNNGYLTTEVDGSVTNELELPQSPNAGEMNYWDGTAWVSVPTGADGQALTLCAGIPTWTTNGICPTSSVTSPTGIIWMDRNLGATQVATSSTDVAAYGDLYQWGRGTDGHQIRTSGTTTVLSTTDQPGHGDFILVSNSSYDWRSGQNNNLWQGVNGVNNPCPSGYRIPTEAEWDQERLSWSSNNNAAGAFTSPLKLPMAGYRSSSDGLLYVVGIGGQYWSSMVSGTSARYLDFSSSLAGVYTDGRAHGRSVRCLKD